MTFNDIFKSSYLEQVQSFSALDMVIALGLAFAVGIFINLVYRKTYRGVMYSQSFGVTLMALTMITSLVIQAVTSNVILSLGMVGALSIVRFRTAIKEPLDIAFLFWAIAAGIVLGAGLLPLGIFGSVVIGLILLVFVNRKSGDNPYVLVLSCDNEVAERKAMDHMNHSVKRHVIKSKTVTTDGIEITCEIRLKEMATSFLNELSALPGVRHASLVSYNGEYMA